MTRLRELRNWDLMQYTSTQNALTPNILLPEAKLRDTPVNEIDKIVERTRELGLYLVITIGNGANNGNHNAQWARDFWKFYAPRYAKEHMYCMKYTMSLWHGDLHILLQRPILPVQLIWKLMFTG